MKPYLDRIQCPGDVKQLDVEELRQLALEIRKLMIKTVSKTGGHIGPNLGVVEMTIALHYCFNSPEDKMVWDVGHQSYVHKLLTGRQEAFPTIRQYKGLSGFPKRDESEHDHFDTGHSSTSISAALGYASGRDLDHSDNHVIAVIGDGALSGGMAYEALNNAAQMKKNFIVVLNDNQMSIAKNVGGMSLYLDKIRTGNAYNYVKEDVQKVLRKVPKIGDELINTVRDLKDGIKQLVIPGMFFEEMGFTYLGPVDGHNLKQLIETFNQAKKVNGPVLVHIHTTKGKGYKIAENHPERFHGIGPFNVKSGEPENPSCLPSYSKVFGKKMLDLGARNKDIVAITAAMPSGTGLNYFEDSYPERFYDVGIAEQHGLTFAAGLAAAGKKPYIALYSSFLQRAYDQLVHDIAIQNLNVTLCIDRAGIVGADGETHQGLMDVSIFNHIPNMTVMAPKTTGELEQCLDFSFNYNEGPLAIRYPRGTDNDFDPYEPAVVKYGKFNVLESGKDAAIIFHGNMYQTAVEVTKKLTEKNYQPTLISALFIKPLDLEGLKTLADHHDHILVIEENMLSGGLGSEILKATNKANLKMNIHLKGIEDIFVTHGTREDLLRDCGLDAQTISEWFLDRIEVSHG